MVRDVYRTFESNRDTGTYCEREKQDDCSVVEPGVWHDFLRHLFYGMGTDQRLRS
jgi:hypothetical protein